MRTFIREKRIYCGHEYLEVDLVPLTGKKIRGRRRKRKEKVSAPAQKNLNDKKAKRYFRQLVKCNFKNGDLHVSCTYKPDKMPATLEAAEKEVSNYIRRINYHRKKMGKGNIRYLIVTEGTVKGDRLVRLHHHILMEAEDRNMVEDLWAKNGKRIGFANADRLQVDGDGGLEAISRYLSKDPSGRKRWRGSQNLIKPVQTKNDSKYSKRKVEQLALVADDDRITWGRLYPGWQMVTCTSIYNDIMGWHIYAEFRRIE